MFPKFPQVVFESGILNDVEPYIVIAGKTPKNSLRGLMQDNIPKNSVNVLVERSKSPVVWTGTVMELLYSGNDVRDAVEVRSILTKTWTAVTKSQCILKGHDADAQILFPDGLPDKIKELPVAEQFYESDIEPLIVSSYDFWLRLKNLIYPDKELKKYIQDLKQFLASPDEANQELAYQFMESFGVPDALRMQIIDTPQRKLLSLKYNILEVLSQFERLSLSGVVIDVLPESLKKLERLNSLNLSNTNLQILPTFIKDLTLKHLDLSENNRLDLAQAFLLLSQSKSLEVLLMNSCQISHLPKETHLMSNLKKLYLRDNYYLPEQDIKELKQALPSLEVVWQEDV